MNQLWVRLSFAFALVLIISFLMTGYIVQQNIVNPDIPPPPEVIAYFEKVQEARSVRVVPNPLMALALLAGMAIIAGTKPFHQRTRCSARPSLSRPRATAFGPRIPGTPVGPPL